MFFHAASAPAHPAGAWKVADTGERPASGDRTIAAARCDGAAHRAVTRPYSEMILSEMILRTSPHL